MLRTSSSSRQPSRGSSPCHNNTFNRRDAQTITQEPSPPPSPTMAGLFGTFRYKLSRKSSNLSHSSSAGGSAPPPGRNMNPFSNPSPATRRPKAQEQPPAYTETPTVTTGPTWRPGLGLGPFHDASSVASGRSSMSCHLSVASSSTPEDPYAFLSSFDTIFLIDDSGSMAGRSWREVSAALRVITPICTAHDADGIDVFFLNHKSDLPASPSKGSAAGAYRGIKDPDAVERLFAAVRPRGGTPTGTRLWNILRPYIALCQEKGDDVDAVRPINIIVFTDGAASDDVETVITRSAKKLDDMDAPPYQVGIQFFQVGNEPGAAEYLRELDDDICQRVNGDGVRDMVDTVTWSDKHLGQRVLSADAVLKTVLGAVVKKLDRKHVGRSASRQNLAP